MADSSSTRTGTDISATGASGLPECAWVDLTLHVTSDSTGIQAGIKIGGCLANIYENEWGAQIKNACTVLNEMGECEDARPMTKDEVKRYRDDKDED